MRGCLAGLAEREGTQYRRLCFLLQPGRSRGEARGRAVHRARLLSQPVPGGLFKDPGGSQSLRIQRT